MPKRKTQSGAFTAQVYMELEKKCVSNPKTGVSTTIRHAQ